MHQSSTQILLLLCDKQSIWALVIWRIPSIDLNLSTLLGPRTCPMQRKKNQLICKIVRWIDVVKVPHCIYEMFVNVMNHNINIARRRWTLDMKLTLKMYRRFFKFFIFLTVTDVVVLCLIDEDSETKWAFLCRWQYEAPKWPKQHSSRGNRDLFLNIYCKQKHTKLVQKVSGQRAETQFRYQWLNESDT